MNLDVEKMQRGEGLPWAAAAVLQASKTITCGGCASQPVGTHKLGCPMLSPLLAIEIWREGDPEHRTAEYLDNKLDAVGFLPRIVGTEPQDTGGDIEASLATEEDPDDTGGGDPELAQAWAEAAALRNELRNKQDGDDKTQRERQLEEELLAAKARNLDLAKHCLRLNVKQDPTKAADETAASGGRTVWEQAAELRATVDRCREKIRKLEARGSEK